MRYVLLSWLYLLKNVLSYVYDNNNIIIGDSLKVLSSKSGGFQSIILLLILPFVCDEFFQDRQWWLVLCYKGQDAFAFFLFFMEG